MPRVCVFTRAPVLGAVKRRLAAQADQAAALDAHETLVRDTLARVSRLRGVVCELWLAGEHNSAVSDWLRQHPMALHRQQGEDLGARMHHALTDALARGSRAVLMGTDCPDIDADYVSRALELLRDVDVVLGPAEDGGYGLIGVRRSSAGRLRQVFTQVPWGSSAVLATTRQRIAEAGCRRAELPVIWDVDTWDDWQRYLARPVPGSD